MLVSRLGCFGKNSPKASILQIYALILPIPFPFLSRLCAWMHQWHPLITPEWKTTD
ncbi:hypothetical protein EON65_39200 [archaeon]|nr:MAG: hypothetical protein EON65_39200 [archaeon]